MLRPGGLHAPRARSAPIAQCRSVRQDESCSQKRSAGVSGFFWVGSVPGGAAGLQIRLGVSVAPGWVRLPLPSAIILDVDVADRPQGNRLQIPPSGFDPEEELLDLTIPFSPP